MPCCQNFANKRNSARRSLGNQCCHFANPLDKAGTRILDRAQERGDAGPVLFSSHHLLQEQLRTHRFLSPFSSHCDSVFC
jgi:hypothetical protein